MSDQKEPQVHFAKAAIEEAIMHYLDNQLSDTKEIETAVEYLTEMIGSVQLWLFFTEGTQEHINTLVFRDPFTINTIMTITTLFIQRLGPLHPGVDAAYRDTLVNACTTLGNRNDTTLMPREYSDRIQPADEAKIMLRDNPHLLMILSMLMYLDVSLIAALLGFRKEP